MKDTTIDVLIIGAGPSGCVAASYLHNNNANIKVVEKSRFPRFVIGESLLPRCMDHFEEVGLLEALKDFGFEKKEGARFLQGDIICEFDFSKKHGDGWNWTWQAPRADFDNVLAQELVKRGAKIKAYDPKAMKEAKEFYLKGIEAVSYVDSKYQAIENVDAMVLLTEWKEFRSPDFDEIKKLLKAPVIFDGRNQYNIFNLVEKGIEYYQIGK